MRKVGRVATGAVPRSIRASYRMGPSLLRSRKELCLRGKSCISSSFSVPKPPYLYKPEKVGQRCRKEIETAKAEGDLCGGISLETLVAKWTCHLVIIVGSIDGII